MGVRISKSFKVAPGVRVRVNAKSTSVTLGGKGARYTVNSRGRRTATVRVAGVSVQNTSGTRGATRAPQAARPATASGPVAKPGLFAPKGEKRLYAALAGQSPAAVARARRCQAVASRYPRQRIAALTMAGLLVLSDDFDLTMRTLGEVYASGVEVADDKFLQRYAPVKSFPFLVGGHKVLLPLNRDLIGLRLAQLHLRAGQLDYAESAVADMKDTPVRHEMERAIAESRHKDAKADDA